MPSVDDKYLVKQRTHICDHHALLEVTDVLVIVPCDPFGCCFRLSERAKESERCPVNEQVLTIVNE